MWKPITVELIGTAPCRLKTLFRILNNSSREVTLARQRLKHHRAPSQSASCRDAHSDAHLARRWIAGNLVGVQGLRLLQREAEERVDDAIERLGMLR